MLLILKFFLDNPFEIIYRENVIDIMIHAPSLLELSVDASLLYVTIQKFDRSATFALIKRLPFML
jgi:hypothetical protein